MLPVNIGEPGLSTRNLFYNYREHNVRYTQRGTGLYLIDVKGADNMIEAF